MSAETGSRSTAPDGGATACDGPYRVLFEHSTHPMVVYDLESQLIRAVSDAYVATVGYSRDELLTMKLTDLLPPDDIARASTFRKKRLSNEHPGRVESQPWRVQRKDGEIVDVEITSDDLEFDGRRCRTAFVKDVTERNRAAVELTLAREQLRASEERYRLLFEQNPHPMVAFDRATLQIVAANDAMVESYGYSRKALRMMTILDLEVDEDGETRYPTQASAEDAAAGGTRRCRRKDGTILDVEITGNDVELDGRACRVALYADVTERNRVAAELEIARDRAVDASNTKSAFLANMSHELRTPMNGVIGMNALLLESGLAAEQRAFADQVARSGEQMLAIINDILDVAKLEAGHVELDLTNFDLHQALADACIATRSQAEANGLSFELQIAPDVPREVRGDGRRLQQILLNLVTNAVKFTSSGGITVAVGANPAAGGSTAVRIVVTDTGIGIERERVRHMFEAFSQADVSTTRIYGGTGLGLAIVSELVELMGGKVTADSEPGRGSTFSVELELAAPCDAETAAARDREARPGWLPAWSTPPRVLVAEDSQVNQIVAARTLERCGCRVEVVGDGREALAALERERYDAILMDCQMPGMDGYEATAELRRREAGASTHTPVIAMTAHAMSGDRERCLGAGMDDYITKPISRADLIEMLRRWIPATPKRGRRAGRSAPTASHPDAARRSRARAAR